MYAADLMEEFKKKGSLLDPEMGMKYRKLILAPGGTHDSIDGLKNFLGREPNPQAYLKYNNFI